MTIKGFYYVDMNLLPGLMIRPNVPLALVVTLSKMIRNLNKTYAALFQM